MPFCFPNLLSCEGMSHSDLSSEERSSPSWDEHPSTEAKEEVL